MARVDEVRERDGKARWGKGPRGEEMEVGIGVGVQRHAVTGRRTHWRRVVGGEEDGAMQALAILQRRRNRVDDGGAHFKIPCMRVFIVSESNFPDFYSQTFVQI